jgi:hypothetical protein
MGRAQRNPSRRLRAINGLRKGSTRPTGRYRSFTLDIGFDGLSAAEPIEGTAPLYSWRHIEQHRFAGMVAKAMDKAVQEQKVPALVVAAPPKTVGDLRSTFHADVRSRVIAEIHKDLTRHPIDDIERHLNAT